MKASTAAAGVSGGGLSPLFTWLFTTNYGMPPDVAATTALFCSGLLTGLITHLVSKYIDDAPLPPRRLSPRLSEVRRTLPSLAAEDAGLQKSGEERGAGVGGDCVRCGMNRASSIHNTESPIDEIRLGAHVFDGGITV